MRPIRFPYRAYQESTPGGDVVEFYRPVIPVTVHGERGAFPVDALLDTGADDTFLPFYLINRVGARVGSGELREFSSIAGHPLTGIYGHVDLEVRVKNRSCRWGASVVFVNEGGGEGERLRFRSCLGWLGFLNHFKATFHSGARFIELAPVGAMPGSHFLR